MHRPYRRKPSFLKRFCILIILIAVVVYVGHKYYPQSTFNADNIVQNSILKEKTFTNMPMEIVSNSGIKAWLIEEHSVPIVSLSFDFERAGKSYDPVGKSGRAAMAAELMAYGAGEYARSAFQEQMELNGIGINFSVGREDFSGSMITPTANLSVAIKLLHTALSAPLFNEDDIKIAKLQMLESLKIQSEKPEAQLGLEFAKELYGKHRYADNPLGKAEDITTLESLDLHSYVKDNLATDVLIIGIAGDITPTQATKMIDEIFSNISQENQNKPLLAPSLNAETKHKFINRSTAQVSSSFVARGTSRQAEDFYPLYIANHIFGGSGLTSRLSLEAREKYGLTYGVYTYLSADKKAPLILGQFSSTPDNYDKMREILHQQWQKFADKGITADELETTRKYLLASYNLRFDSVAGLAGMLKAMQKEQLGLDFLQKRNDYVRNVTLEEVNAAIKKYFSVLPMEMAIGQLDK